jgi:FG-GAP repeat protein
MAGAVHVMYGSAGGLTSDSDETWHQDSPQIHDVAEVADRFGEVVTAADFDGDGFDELAITASTESIGTASESGAVHVIHGSRDGLIGDGNQMWHQNSPGILDFAEASDWFGMGLAASGGQGFTAAPF